MAILRARLPPQLRPKTNAWWEPLSASSGRERPCGPVGSASDSTR
jgi:hypothetical protein